VTGRLVAGRYRLDEVLGRGGMGIVWAGHDTVLERPVAIKEVVPPREADDAERVTLRERTMREARTAARISAEGVVALYDVVEDDARPWIVMERLPARTLADEVADRGPLPSDEVVAVADALLAGLAAAHTAGILHRDVKPSNVMFRHGPTGRRAVLVDFGIAHLDGDATLTATGMMMGSPAYLAPERAHGRPAGPAADLWSLGVTLWTALEGRSPFLRENALATLTAVITEEVPTTERAGPLGPLLAGLLRKDPDERLDAGSARDLLDRMGTAAHVPVATTAALPAAAPALPPAGDDTMAADLFGDEAPPGEPDPAPPPAPDGPNRRPLAVVAVLALLLGAVLVGVTVLRPDGGGDGGEEAASEQQTEQAPAEEADPGGEAAPLPPAEDAEPAPPEEAPEAPQEPAPAPAPEDGGGEPEQGAGAGAPGAPADAPPGMERYTDPTGFSVAVPQGWRAERDGPRVYLRDPGSSAYLLVDQTDTPAADPVADWQQQEPAVARRLTNYERLGEIVALDFRGWRAADWQFVFGREQGTRVLNRNLVTAPDKAYALYWSVPTSRWEEMLPVHEQVVGSFEPER
jgi:eukaryotic-like serine/threonine-protein kinase